MPYQGWYAIHKQSPLVRILRTFVGIEISSSIENWGTVVATCLSAEWSVLALYLLLRLYLSLQNYSKGGLDLDVGCRHTFSDASVQPFGLQRKACCKGCGSCFLPENGNQPQCCFFLDRVGTPSHTQLVKESNDWHRVPGVKQFRLHLELKPGSPFGTKLFSFFVVTTWSVC